MNHKKRRILFYFIFLSFAILAPALTFYTAGYRYDSQKQKIVQSGSILIKTDPSGANVFLEESSTQKKYFGVTPFRLHNIHPDDYVLTLEKRGYFPWKRTLQISAGETNLLTHITLFQKKMPDTLSAKTFNTLYSSPLFFFQQKLTGILKNKGTEEIEEILLSFPETEQLLFRKGENDSSILSIKGYSNNLESLLIEIFDPRTLKKKYYLINTLSEELILLNQNEKNNRIKNITWNWDRTKLIFQSSDNLALFDILSQENEEIINYKNIEESYNRKNDIFFLVKNEKKFELFAISLAEKEKKYTSLSFPSGDWESPKFIDVPSPYVGLLDEKTNIFIIFNPEKSEILLKSKAKNIEFFEDTLYYWNEFEISKFSFLNKKDELIARYGAPLEKVLILKRYKNYFLTVQNNQVNIREIFPENPNSWILQTSGKIYDIAVNAKNNTLFVATEEGLLRFNIR